MIYYFSGYSIVMIKIYLTMQNDENDETET